MVGLGFAPLAVRCALIVFVNCVPTPLGERCITVRATRICEPRVPPSKTLDPKTTFSSRGLTCDYYRKNSSPLDFSAQLGRLSIWE
jgi:hypothetical protein